MRERFWTQIPRFPNILAQLEPISSLPIALQSQSLRLYSSHFMERRHSHHQFITIGGTSSRPKYTTRHLAALDFLLNVPMKKEEEIRHVGVLNASRMKEDSEEVLNEDNDDLTTNDESKRTAPPPGLATELLAAQFADYAGKKLQGPHCPVGRYPNHFRHHLQKLTEHSALVRQWEDQLLCKGINTLSTLKSSLPPEPSILSNRIYFSRAHCYPMLVCSIIKYDAGEEKARLEKLRAEDTKGLEVYNLPHRDWRGFSYKPLFKQLQDERNGEYYFEHGFLYDPHALDDPAMIHGAHRYVLQRSASTGPILSSVILYVNKKELKASLNEQFHEKHPHIPPSLTLSKIRNIKKAVVLIGCQLDMELSTLAMGCILFEKLCLKCLVTKINRKLSMAVCMLLAYKFNENNPKYHSTLELLLAFFDAEWDLPKKQIFEAEFGAYVHLGFLMHFPYQHIHWMYLSLLKIINKSSRMYLKDEMHDLYRRDTMDIERAKEAMASQQKVLLQVVEQKEEGKEEEVVVEEVSGSSKAKRRLPMAFNLLGRSTKNIKAAADITESESSSQQLSAMNTSNLSVLAGEAIASESMSGNDFNLSISMSGEPEDLAMSDKDSSSPDGSSQKCTANALLHRAATTGVMEVGGLDRTVTHPMDKNGPKKSKGLLSGLKFM